jgi:hypothetical protein
MSPRQQDIIRRHVNGPARRLAATRRRQHRRECLSDIAVALFVVGCGVGLCWVGGAL